MPWSNSQGEDAEKQNYSYIAGGNVEWYSHSGKQLDSVLKTTYATTYAMWHSSCIYPKEKHRKKQNLYTNVHSSFIQSSQNLEITQVSINV